ncbi:hypothetical protein SAMN02927900_02521 [Rhizobium mongolense subsp. loessense]|uniref:Uncharacterized protein n=1 Tax=Rhizobium mongolense subsp. loessense TaxID=158890 RepID=A0A1G4RDT0_9HYPH|nr:hypothetical protein [Rhizobium mongolense]SCW55082.1 hypothetical protein SAMN02927900_02521 [Rhizobium mongolense subsp. loessense]
MLLTWILSAGIVVTTLMSAASAIFGDLTPLAVASFVPINPMALLFIAVLAYILGPYLMAAEATASKPMSASRNGRTGWRRRRERVPYGTRVRRRLPLHSSSHTYRIACSFSSKRCICAMSGVA